MQQRDAWHLTEDILQENGRGDPFAAAMRATRMPMVISDPRLDDLSSNASCQPSHLLACILKLREGAQASARRRTRQLRRQVDRECAALP